jgi:hypothetical protein
VNPVEYRIRIKIECIKNTTDNGNHAHAIQCHSVRHSILPIKVNSPANPPRPNSPHIRKQAFPESAKSLCKTGRSSRFLNGVMNPTTARKVKVCIMRSSEYGSVMLAVIWMQ